MSTYVPLCVFQHTFIAFGEVVVRARDLGREWWKNSQISLRGARALTLDIPGDATRRSHGVHFTEHDLELLLMIGNNTYDDLKPK